MEVQILLPALISQKEELTMKAQSFAIGLLLTFARGCDIMPISQRGVQNEKRQAKVPV